ncbi:MAG: hypothetical protein EXR53_03230 [Dehalococcoidia bacterium]|nr:hypothetical protein [Dehalococcoidia bacterium]
MSFADLFLLLIRWLHALAAIAWVGGSIFFLAVLRPALRDTPQEAALNRIAGQEFRNLVDTAVWALLVTGVILSINRLTSGYASGAYGLVLGVKIALAVWMFYLAWFRQRRSAASSDQEQKKATPVLVRAARATFSATNLILILGLLVILLADILRNIFEHGVTRG